ncbi:MAG: electron transport complex subunit RsxE [Candidatus Aureabacteria bacterium]|nr:electron transport complex subunit RsxE [Candidatus Auribacterota bacterium]
MSKENPTALERFIWGIIPENPIFRQVLGTCPALAVSTDIKAALTMTCATAFVLICANTIISLIRHLLKPHLRIVVFVLTIASFVTIVDYLLAAFYYSMSLQLGPYVPLIIVNCIIICRCEVCASKQSVGVAISDAIGQSLGFGLALVSMASFREILGSGTWCGFRIMPDSWPNWVLMLLPPGAFFVFGFLIGAVNWFTSLKKNKSS